MSSVLRDPAIQISHPQKEESSRCAAQDGERPTITVTAPSGGWRLEIDQRSQPTPMTR